METLLLGSGAAEGWPAPYCACAACEEVRRRGGVNLRSRTGALIDNDLKVDHGPDTVMQMQRLGRSLAGVRTIVFTHEHGDHFAVAELEWATQPYTLTPAPEPIAIFGNDAVLAAIRAEYPDLRKNRFELHRLQALEPATTPARDVVLPLPADHTAGALLLRITRGGKTLFYGHDSGLYPEETLDALSDGVALDVALLDCNYGGQQSSNRNHMGVDGVIAMTDELRRRGAVTGQTRVIATHFSHAGGWFHEDLIRELLPHGIEVAYDGMLIAV